MFTNTVRLYSFINLLLKIAIQVHRNFNVQKFTKHLLELQVLQCSFQQYHVLLGVFFFGEVEVNLWLAY